MSETVKTVKKLDNWTLFKTGFKTCNFINQCTTYPRFMATGLASGLIPVLKKLYADRPEEIKDALQKYGEAYYLCGPSTAAGVAALIATFEEQRANGADISRDSVNALKTGIMGGLTGFDDTIFTSTLRPLAMAVFAPMSIAGNVMGPIGFMLFKGCARYAVAILSFVACRKLGKEAITSMTSKSGILQRAIELVSVLSMFVMGAMTCQYVNPSFALEVVNNGTTTSLQAFLNSALPGVLPLATVFAMYGMMVKKKMNPMIVILIFLAISLVGCLIGLF